MWPILQLHLQGCPLHQTSHNGKLLPIEQLPDSAVFEMLPFRCFYLRTRLPSAHDQVLNRPFNRPLRPLVPVETNRGAHAPPKFPLNPLPPPRLGATPIRNLPATPTRCRIFLQAGSSRPLAHLSPPLRITRPSKIQRCMELICCR